MLGVRSAQFGLLEADHLYMDFVGRDSFYGFLASMRGQLFKDGDFAKLYCRDNGRDSVPPSMMATALLLQTHDKVSDEEAKERADFDIRWKVALGIGIEDKPFAKSTLQLFRAHLILHEKVRAVFQRSLRFAKETGYLKGHRMKAAIDTSFILGRGAVKDTYNLLADGIVQLVRALAQIEGVETQAWAEQHGLGCYFGSSIKGESVVDWDDEKARNVFLQGIVSDADRMLELARQAQAGEPEESDKRKHIMAAGNLLGQLLLQDVERKGNGAALKQEVSRDRIVSVHDPEMRHGRKSSSNRFDGHKVAVVVDTDSQLITAVEVLPGNAHDHTGAVELVKQSEQNTGTEVEVAIGDAAYGDGATRQAFVDAERTLVAKVPGRPDKAFFPKDDFKIDLKVGTCTCPSGQVAQVGRILKSRTDGQGKWQRFRGFIFDIHACAVCSLRPKCVASKTGKGRTVTLHPQEALLQQARALQHSEAFSEYRKRRQVSEHRIARLVQLGIRQARYFGRAKTRFQLLLSAAVANLTLVATATGMMRKPYRQAISRPDDLCQRIMSGAKAIVTRLCRFLVSIRPLQEFQSRTTVRTGGYRPDF